MVKRYIAGRDLYTIKCHKRNPTSSWQSNARVVRVKSGDDLATTLAENPWLKEVRPFPN